MLPVQIGLQMQEALEDRVITGTESTQMMTTMFNSVVVAMVFAFGVLMFNKAIGGSSNPGNPNTDRKQPGGSNSNEEELRKFVRELPFMPERGKPLPDYVYRAMKPEFITSVMEAPVSSYGRELQDRVALDAVLFLRGGGFSITERFRESGWSSEDIAYDARVRHDPTSTEWDIEIWAPFDWRKPETYRDGFVMFLPTGKELEEGRWEVMPEEEWETDTFELSSRGGEDAANAIKEFVGGRR